MKKRSAEEVSVGAVAAGLEFVAALGVAWTVTRALRRFGVRATRRDVFMALTAARAAVRFVLPDHGERDRFQQEARRLTERIRSNPLYTVH